MNNKIISREEAIDIAKSIKSANFFMCGNGHFDLSTDEIANIILIAVNRNDRAECLDRYYNILHDKKLQR